MSRINDELIKRKIVENFQMVRKIRIKHVQKIKDFCIENKYGHIAVWPHKLYCLEW